MELQKIIRENTYVTYALTEVYADGEIEILGMTEGWKDCEYSSMQLGSSFYWSEIYCEQNHMATIIRKGIALPAITKEIGNALQKQSIINLKGRNIEMTERENDIVKRYTIK